MRVRRGGFTLDAHLSVERGEVLAILGPNGAGKSTVLAVLAGLLLPSAGYVNLDGHDLTRIDDDGRVRTAVPAEGRAIGLLGQDPLVFPHLTAAANIAFGPRAHGVPRAAASTRAERWLSSVGLCGLGARRSAELSGGQRQRVALARALAAEPRVLLLDEPLAALDVHSAPAMRQLLREQIARTGTTTVLVTHDVLDAVVLADRVMVLDAGRVVDTGAAATVLAAPKDRFTASLAGLNLVMGVGAGGAVEAPDGRRFVGVGLPGELRDGDRAAAVFAPSAVAVSTSAPVDASPRNVWRTEVVALEPGGSTVRLRTAGDPQVLADLTPASVTGLGLRPGSVVWLSVKATEVGLHRR
jgi:molybdate transport system ATP-binding protein